MTAIFNFDIEKEHKMTLTTFCQIFYQCPSFLELMQIKCKFFLIDSLDVTLQMHIFNISSLLNAPKIEKTENGVETYETPFMTN